MPRSCLIRRRQGHKSRPSSLGTCNRDDVLSGASLLRACVLIDRLFEAYPTPSALAAADVPSLEAMLKPLGLHATRARKLTRFSREWLHSNSLCYYLLPVLNLLIAPLIANR